MRLDILCIRDILLCVEEHTDYRCVAKFIDLEICSNISRVTKVPEYNHVLYDKYGMDKVLYHVNYCVDAELVLAVETERSSYIFTIVDLTPLGYDMVNDMRDSTIAERMSNLKSA